MYKWMAAVLATLLVTSGCGTVARNETSPSSQHNNNIRAQQTEPRAAHIADSTDVAAHLEELAVSVPGVENAHAVIMGNTAVVGIDVDAGLDRSRVGTIKYSVAEAFHKDPYGVNALVTADMDLTERIRELGEDIRNGKPVAGFAEELADIMGRIIPQVPREVMPKDTDYAQQQANERQAPSNGANSNR